MPQDPALEQLRQLALTELAASPAPRPWWRDAALLAGVNLLVTVVCTVGLGKNGLVLNQSPAAAVAAVAVPVVLVLLLGALAAVIPWRPGRAGAWGGTLLALAGVTGLAVAFGGSGHADPARGLLRAGLPCLTTELVISVVPITAAVLVLARFAYSPWRMLVGGLSAGAAGLFALHLHCPIGTLGHLAAFHVLPWLAVAGLAVLLRGRVRSHSYAP